ncbi:hypothetical protein F0562_030248 [Nyssa sinensis]|uniref:Uncharacterized protein n=1 Tax=Nyssa sinensis TaxID=561372 RepID=A0A5J5AVW7_9ASTE|nr:hypothetical protein F0562_030248 [Nyssa sinensis]
MASNSILNSSSSEQRWVDQMSRMLKKDVVIDINEVGPSVFEVPKSMSALKPEAYYTPQLIGLGPYHHFRPELYQMQRSKLAAAKGVLKPDQILNFEELMIHGLKEFEPTIRMCYNKYLDLDPNTLAWILAIDGLFLLHFFNTDLMHKHNQDHFAGDKLKNEAFISDIMMVENQIPVFLLKRILMTSCTFMEMIRLDRHLHLRERKQKGNDHANRRKTISSAGAGAGAVLENVRQISDVTKILGESLKVEEIKIPRVSRLCNFVKIKFSPSPDDGGIRDIELNEKELTFYLPVITHLPVITLKVNSEVLY